MPTLGSRLMPTARQSLAQQMGVGEMRLHSNKAGCSDTVTDAHGVSHINGWVSLVSDIQVGLAYLIDLPEKTQAKTGRGEEKRQFLTEKASDRESFGVFRHNTANNKHHTRRRFPVGTRVVEITGGIFFHDGRGGLTICVLLASPCQVTWMLPPPSMTLTLFCFLSVVSLCLRFLETGTHVFFP